MTSYEKAMRYLKFRIDNEYRTIIKPGKGAIYEVQLSTPDPLIFHTFRDLVEVFAMSYDDEVDAGNIKEDYTPAEMVLYYPNVGIYVKEDS